MTTGKTSEIPAGQSASFWGRLMVSQGWEPDSSTGMESRGHLSHYPGYTCPWAGDQSSARIAPPDSDRAPRNDRGA